MPVIFNKQAATILIRGQQKLVVIILTVIYKEKEPKADRDYDG